MILQNSFIVFDNLKCPDQNFVDTRTSTNPRRTRNTLLACVRIPRLIRERHATPY